MNQNDQLLKLQEADSTVAKIMELCEEATKVHEQALVAMGQHPIASQSTVASTQSVMSLSSDLSSRKEHK